MPVNINESIRQEPTARTFLRSWGNPEQQYALTQAMRADRYRHLWMIYDGTAFDDQFQWAQYRRAFGLYRAIRQVWDHAHQLVEFYATHVYSGSLAMDGLVLPDGVDNAVPLAPGTDATLAAAIAQLWVWWNWQEMMTIIPRYAAALGELLVEINDDPRRGKVLINPVWPSYVKDITLDESGNVIAYEIAYNVRDPKTYETFQYRRKVDKDYFTTYKDDEPFDYAAEPLPPGTVPYGEYVVGSGEGEFADEEDGAQIENPYGFCPAVWYRHHRLLGVRGEPAIWATQAQMDEANQLFAHLLDKAHVSLEAPILVAGNVQPNALQRALNNMVGAVKRTFTEDLGSDPVSERETFAILEGPAGTKVETIEIEISEAVQALDRIIASIEKKCPEVTFYQQLRNMTQLTGPAANRLLGDVDRKVRSIAAGYDRSTVKLLQMGISVAAYRLNEGAEGWAKRDDQQQKFANYDETSYDKGDLDFDIMPRSVVPSGPRDRYELLQLKKQVLGDFLSPQQLAMEGGYSPEEIERFTADWEKRKAEAFARQQDLMRQQAEENATVPQPIRRPPGAPPGGPQRGQPDQRRRPPAGATEQVG